MGHSHRSLENRVCHWGFDSTNWRSYLLLAKEKTVKGAPAAVADEKKSSRLDEVKERFNVLARTKRKVKTGRDNSIML